MARARGRTQHLPSGWSWPAAASVRRRRRRGRDRLAFAPESLGRRRLRMRLGSPPAPLIESTFNDMIPQYSPDGRRIAFESGRSGEEEIWLADVDGSNPTRLTRGPGRGQGAPRWSPDGRSIAFDSRRGERQLRHLDDRRRRLGPAPGHARSRRRHPPSWSRDGRFVYFGSNRTGRDEVWRVAAAGRDGGAADAGGRLRPFESLDGRTLYYLRNWQNGALLARPTGGGEERTIVPASMPGATPSGRRASSTWAATRRALAPPRSASCATGTRRRGRTGRSRTIEGAWSPASAPRPTVGAILYGTQPMASRPDDDRELPLGLP